MVWWESEHLEERFQPENISIQFSTVTGRVQHGPERGGEEIKDQAAIVLKLKVSQQILINLMCVLLIFF